MPLAQPSRLASRPHGSHDSSAYLNRVCGRRWRRMNQRGERRIIVLLQQPFGICDDPDYSTLKRSLTMNTYVAIIGGKAVLTFRAVDDDQAHAMIDDQEGGVRSDLKVLVDTDGKP